MTIHASWYILPGWQSIYVPVSQFMGWRGEVLFKKKTNVWNQVSLSLSDFKGFVSHSSGWNYIASYISPQKPEISRKQWQRSWVVHKFCHVLLVKTIVQICPKAMYNSMCMTHAIERSFTPQELLRGISRDSVRTSSPPRETSTRRCLEFYTQQHIFQAFMYFYHFLILVR